MTPPNLGRAVMNFECKVHAMVEMETFVIVIGKVIKISTSDKTALDKVYSLGGWDYGAIKEVETLQHGRV